MTLRRLTRAGVLALTCAAAGVWAADLVLVQKYKLIPYVTGGVGDAEQAAMRKLAPEYNLGLVFSGKEGRYISGVNVTVKNPSDEVVFSAVTEGPMLFADLPAGRYTVEATFDGTTHTRQVTLAEERHRRVVMTWPVSEPDLTEPGRAS